MQVCLAGECRTLAWRVLACDVTLVVYSSNQFVTAVSSSKSDMIGQASDKGDDSTTTSRLYRIVTANWTKDDPPRLPSWQHIRLRIFTRPSRGEASSEREQDCTDDHLRLCDGPAVVRFLKFLVITIIFICAAHQIVRWMVRYIVHRKISGVTGRACAANPA